MHELVCLLILSAARRRVCRFPLCTPTSSRLSEMCDKVSSLYFAGWGYVMNARYREVVQKALIRFVTTRALSLSRIRIIDQIKISLEIWNKRPNITLRKIECCTNMSFHWNGYSNKNYSESDSQYTRRKGFAIRNSNGIRKPHHEIVDSWQSKRRVFES